MFATKAGILGMVLGGATIAAGVGVVYNFIGPSSKPVYTPQLFQDIYYEEQSQKASLERAQQKEGAAASDSTLDMFIQQAKQDGLSAGGGAAGESRNASVEEAAAGAPAEDTGGGGGSPNAAANAPAGGGARLQASAGFGSAKGGGSGGGSSTKLSGGGGMFGGINGQFTPVYRPPAGQGAQGKSSGMKGSLASAVRNSPKQVVPNFNRKGALGQARAAKSLGARAVNAPSMVASQTDATRAFLGETVGTGEIGSAGGGVGLGGSGISSGDKLKTSDPNLNSNDTTLPKATEAEVESPWKEYTDMAMYAMLAAAVLLFLAGWLNDKAKAKALAAASAGPAAPAMYLAAAALYGYAKIAAGMAMVAAGVVMFAGYKLMSEFGQKWTGIMYMAAGGMLLMKAYTAFSGASNGATAAETNSQVTQQAIYDTKSPFGDVDAPGGLNDMLK
ncbi:MAG: hypothetical protein WCK76_14020 [Elusimicrobiota bacterium]